MDWIKGMKPQFPRTVLRTKTFIRPGPRMFYQSALNDIISYVLYDYNF